SGSREACLGERARSYRTGAIRRRLAPPVIHVRSTKVLLGREQIVRPATKLEVCYRVRSAEGMRSAVVQLQTSSLGTASPPIIGVGASPGVARPQLTTDRGAHVAPRRRGGGALRRSIPRRRGSGALRRSIPRRRGSGALRRSIPRRRGRRALW